MSVVRQGSSDRWVRHLRMQDEPEFEPEHNVSCDDREAAESVTRCSTSSDDASDEIGMTVGMLAADRANTYMQSKAYDGSMRCGGACANHACLDILSPISFLQW